MVVLAMSFLEAAQLGLSVEQQLHRAYRFEAELHVAHEKISTLKAEVSQLTEENNRLREQLKLAQQRHFGQKSEVGEPLAEASSFPLTQVNAHTRKKKTKGRLIDCSLLPKRRVYHDLPENEKTCACCQKPLKRIGEDVSEQIEVLPQRLYVEEHVRYKYACGDCETIRMSPKEKAPLPKALAGGSLLTEVIINKYQYHLPLYRQSKILASFHAIIPDNTLGNWVMQAGDGLVKIYEALWDAFLAARYVQVDETPIKILNPDLATIKWTHRSRI